MVPGVHDLMTAFAGIGKDLDAIHTSGTATIAEMAALRTSFASVTESLDTMEGAFGTAGSSMSEIQGEAQGTAGSLGEVADAMERTRSVGTDIYAGVAEQLGYVTDASRAAAQAEDELGAGVSRAAQDVETLVAEMNDLRSTDGFGGIIAAMPELQQLDDRILALREDVAGLAEPGAASAEALGQLESRITATGEAMSAVESIIPTFTGDIEAFSAAAARGAEANTAAQESFTGMAMGAGAAGGEVAAAGAEAGKASGLVGMLGDSLSRYGADPFMWMYMGPMLAVPALAALTTAIRDNAGSGGVLVDNLRQQYGAVGDNIAGYQAYAHALQDGGAANQQLTRELTTSQAAVDRFGTSAGNMGQVQAGVAAETDHASSSLSNLAGNLGTLEQQYGITAGQAQGLAHAAGVLPRTLADGGSAAEAAMAKIQAFGDANMGAAARPARWATTCSPSATTP